MKAYDSETQKLIQLAEDNRLDNPSVVLESARILRDTAKENDDLDLLGFADYSMANAYFILNDADSVRHYAERALPSLNKAENWALAANCLNVMALAEKRAGNIIKAMDLLTSAGKYVEKYDLKDMGVLVYMNFADIYMQLESYDEVMTNILIAETYLNNCPDDTKHAYYYMVVSSEAAYYAKRSNQIDLYEKHRKILNGILKKYPEYSNEINVLLLEYQEASDSHDSEREEELIEEIRVGLFSTMNFLDYTNETMDFLNILKNTKKYAALEELLEFVTQSMNGYESDGITAMISSFKIQYYLDTEQKEKLNTELYEYWDHTRSNREKSNETLISLLKTRRNLEVSEQTNERLKELAETDGLTSLPNRRALNMKLDQIFELAYHQKHYLGVEMLDIDNFKRINDSYGHSTGDDALVLIGKCLNEITDEHIYAARYGGDEFVILFDDLKDDVILKVNEKLRESMAKGIASAALPVFTISQGVFAKVPLAETRPWDFTSTADAALYVTKRNGKDNLLLVHSPKELKDTTANSYIANSGDQSHIE
jgi:diguanylate cyclase (GGDEF)-like protein